MISSVSDEIPIVSEILDNRAFFISNEYGDVGVVYDGSVDSTVVICALMKKSKHKICVKIDEASNHIDSEFLEFLSTCDNVEFVKNLNNTIVHYSGADAICGIVDELNDVNFVRENSDKYIERLKTEFSNWYDAHSTNLEFFKTKEFKSMFYYFLPQYLEYNWERKRVFKHFFKQYIYQVAHQHFCEFLKK